MKAIITEPYKQNGKNLGDKKETMDTYNVIAYYKGEFYNVITCRTYMGRSSQASTVYASIWCHSRLKNIDCAGHGSAGGYGYHKSSAAIGSAISSAGIELYGSPYLQDEQDYKKRAYIGGVGETAIESALTAIAQALGYRKIYICKG